MEWRALDYEGAGIYVTRSGYTGEDGFEISLPAAIAEGFALRLLDHPDVDLLASARATRCAWRLASAYTAMILTRHRSGRRRLVFRSANGGAMRAVFQDSRGFARRWIRGRLGCASASRRKARRPCAGRRRSSQRRSTNRARHLGRLFLQASPGPSHRLRRTRARRARNIANHRLRGRPIELVVTKLHSSRIAMSIFERIAHDRNAFYHGP